MVSLSVLLFPWMKLGRKQLRRIVVGLRLVPRTGILRVSWVGWQRDIGMRWRKRSRFPRRTSVGTIRLALVRPWCVIFSVTRITILIMSPTRTLLAMYRCRRLRVTTPRSLSLLITIVKLLRGSRRRRLMCSWTTVGIPPLSM